MPVLLALLCIGAGVRLAVVENTMKPPAILWRHPTVGYFFWIGVAAVLVMGGFVTVVVV